MASNDFENLFLRKNQVTDEKDIVEKIGFDNLLDYSINDLFNLFWKDFEFNIFKNNLLNPNSFEEAFYIFNDLGGLKKSLKKFHIPTYLEEIFNLIDEIENTFEEKDKFAFQKIVFKFVLIQKIISLNSSIKINDWLSGIKTKINKSQFDSRRLEAFLRRLSGETLQEIADKDGVTREAIRLAHNRMNSFLKLDESEFSEIQNIFLEKIDNYQFFSFLNEFGRLPLESDIVREIFKKNKFYKDCVSSTLTDRLQIYEKFNFEVPKEEYDFHYEFFKSNPSGGTYYWDNFENLKQYVFRHAEFLGEPDTMPKQTSFKRTGVKGAITKHGGQSKMADKIGLKYQGQLVSDGKGRKFWTDEKIYKLLDDINDFHDQSREFQPSWTQICDFFKKTEDPLYKGKKPQAPVAAMTSQGNISWVDAAKKYGKKNISGVSQRVNLHYIKSFVRDLGEHLAVLTTSELYVLLQAEGIASKGKKFSRTYDVLIDAFQNGEVEKKDLVDWSNNIEVPVISELLDLGSDVNSRICSKEERDLILLNRRRKVIKKNIKKPKIIDLNDLHKEDLPSLDPIKTLKALDKATTILNERGSDIGLVNFLKAKATSKLWDSCFSDENAFLENLNSNYFDKDSYSSEIKNSFLEEYYGAKNLKIPESYKFRDLKGFARQPKLMQRLVAFRLLRDKRLLNLSGTGTGKTLSAILAAQICKTKRIFITCPNGVIDSWVRTFESAFPSAILHPKPKNWKINLQPDKVNVAIFNHERFQDRFSEEMLQFCVEFEADMIVIDEIHQAKSRSPEISSQRRALISELVRISSNLMPDLRVLGLSATPVINNIYEGASLIELITQKKIEGARSNDINACMILYQQFILNGIRMNPSTLSRTKIHREDIDISDLLPYVIEITNSSRIGNYHEIERLIVPSKLDSLNEFISENKKTIIFITNIKGTLIPIRDWLKEKSIDFCVYTGEDKDATEAGFKDSLDEFIKGKTKVLIASVQCAGTGIDGLQSVCNNVVFFQLPWTSTEFEQAIGRLDRDGTEFEQVNVYLPMTNIQLPSGDNWSWCQSKLDRIESKKDIAKAAVDGDMPNSGSIISPKEATKLWLNWLKRLENS